MNTGVLIVRGWSYLSSVEEWESAPIGNTVLRHTGYLKHVKGNRGFRCLRRGIGTNQ